MPVSLGEWRVRIGTFMRRRRKEYDYHYYWRKLQNLIKKTKNAEPPKENNNPDCNVSSPTGTSLDANSSPGKSACSASFYNVNLNTTSCDVSNVPSCDVSNSRGNANSQSRSQCDGPGCEAVEERGFPSDVKSPGHYDVTHSESLGAENSGSPTVNETNPVPDTTDVPSLVPRPCVEDELDNRHITINLMTHEYTPNSTEIDITYRPEVRTSEWYSHVPAHVPGETDCINQDKEETSNSAPSGIEDQSSDLSPKPSQDTMINTRQRTSSIREVANNHGSPTYPVLQSGTTSGEADAVKGNDCPDMTNILLLRSGDVEQNPGPYDNPGSLTELELYLLAEGIDPSDFRKVGLALGFTEAQLSRFEMDKLGNSMQATYQMLYEWRKTVQGSEAREILVNKFKSIKLVQLADSVRKGQVGDHIPSMTEEEIKQVAEDLKRYLTIHLCQIQADPLNSELLLKFEQIFTNLTLMEEDKSDKKKTPLLYNDLLKTKVNGIYPKRLLVEGEGGVGKTTFCAKIAWDWIHGKGYQDFKLVLVVLLREEEDKTVGEIVKSYLPDDNLTTAKQLDKYILSNPKDVFLVLDGLDESNVDLNSNHQIALITCNRLLKSGIVLITSRQWRSDEIRKNTSLRKVFAFIAVEGFSAENLSSYITKFFHPDSASSDALNRFIANNDMIRESMAPFPIYTAMLCIMWKDFDGKRQGAMSKLQTFFQLFDEMVNFLVDHYLSKFVVSSADVDGELDRNRSKILDHVEYIGCVAFQCLLERRLVCREEEFQSCPGSVDTGCKVGILTKEKQIPSRSARRHHSHSAVLAVHFPHKLFQEYLSGMYLASLYKSNRDEYDGLIANIMQRAGEYRYLLYFTSAQQKEAGLDIVSRLIASNKEHERRRIEGSITNVHVDDEFIVDVAYESQDQSVVKAVADHLSSGYSFRKELTIYERMQAHTVLGHIFIMNRREVNNLSIMKSCGQTASEELAEFICSSRLLRSVKIAGATCMHDVFYSVLANKAVNSKIRSLTVSSSDPSKSPSVSRDLAQFICKMPYLEDLELDCQFHDDFFSTLSSMASSPKIEALKICSLDLSDRPSASRDLAQFICKMTHLKDLTLGRYYDGYGDNGPTVLLHDDFYSVSSLIALSAKIEALYIRSLDLSERPSASCDLAQFICKLTQLKYLSLGKQDHLYSSRPKDLVHSMPEVLLHDDFYSTSSSIASSVKIETLYIRSLDLSERPSASSDLAQFICKIPYLKDLTLGVKERDDCSSYPTVLLHDNFYSTSSLLASSAKIEKLNIRSEDLSERPSASHDLAQFICKMPHLKNLPLHGRYHNDFFSTVSSMASSAKIETLYTPVWDLSERSSASHDLAQFICKMTHLEKLTLNGQYHDDFYSASSSMASSAKIDTLVTPVWDLRERPSASRDLAQFVCKMTHLNSLTLNGQYHNDFYSTSSSMASFAKVETLTILWDDLSERPSASHDLAQFICKIPHLKDLSLCDEYHDDFFSTSSSMASSAKIDVLRISGDFSKRPSASRDLAQFICKMTHLKTLELQGQFHDDFYSTSSEMASSAKIETLTIDYDYLSKRPSASHDFAQFICKMPHLKKLSLEGQYHDDFYSTSSSSASSAKIETLTIDYGNLSERPFASRDLAQFICKMTHLKELSLQDQYHDDFYSTSSSIASSAKIETLKVLQDDLSERPSASSHLAQFICKMPHLKNLDLDGQYHDDFFSTTSSMASSVKIKTLNICTGDVSKTRSASRDLAQFICKMTHLNELSFDGHFHDDFYSTSSSMASFAKIETLNINYLHLSECPSASRNLAQFICKMPRLKNLALGVGEYMQEVLLHDEFYSSSSLMASSVKIETLTFSSLGLSKRPSASRDLAQFICKMPCLNSLTLDGKDYKQDVPLHDSFYSSSSSMALSVKIETLNINHLDLSKRPSASRDLAQFICKMPRLNSLTLGGAGDRQKVSLHDDFYSSSASMASSAKVETLNIWSMDLSTRPSASCDLVHFICKMPHLKKLTLCAQYHEDFYSTSSSMASSAKIETLGIWSMDLSKHPSASCDLAQFICKLPCLKSLRLGGGNKVFLHDDFYSTSSSISSPAKIETLGLFLDLIERPSASRDIAQFICKMPHLKYLDLNGHFHKDFFSTSSSMASSAMSGNTSPTLTELTVDDETLRGWQDCGSMFNNVKSVTIEVWGTITCDVIQRIHLPGATELTIQTHEAVRQPAGFLGEPTSLPDALLSISPKLVKVTFSDLVIDNSKMEQILQAFRSTHNLEHLKISRFIRCWTDESMDDVIIACNEDRVMEVEVVHGEPQGTYFETTFW